VLARGHYSITGAALLCLGNKNRQLANFTLNDCADFCRLMANYNVNPPRI
jgi:hypothetical protein